MPTKTENFGSPALKDRKGDSRMWAVRSTLMRMKRPERVFFNAYEPAMREHPMGESLDKNNPPSNPFDCADEDCGVCCPQFFPASHVVNDDEAHEIVSRLVNSIKADLGFLRGSLNHHADFLVTRWKKKSREKRFSFLTANTDLFDKKWAAIHMLDRVGCPGRKYDDDAVFPRVVTRRSPDGGFTICLEFNTPQSLHDAQLSETTLVSHQDSWFLPYLDAEMLSEDPSLFLSLLHHRTANDPDKWLTFDNSNIVLVEHLSIMTQTFNPNCVVMQGPDYGKLVKWNARQAHRWEIIGFTKAHCLLTAQQKMMALLRKCVVNLLAEATAPPKLVDHPKWNNLIATNFSRFETNFAWSTDSVKPFSNPPSFDSLEVMELIASRHRAIKDELELLQTDPEYVQLRVRELSSCLFFESFRNEDVMPFLVDHLFNETMHREQYWRQLAGESERMGVCLKALRDSPSEEAQDDFDRYVWIVQDLCIETFAVFEPQVGAGLLLQRGFERNFEFSGNGKFNKLHRTFSRQDWFPEDILYWSLSSLGYDEDRPFTMDPSLNFAIIDYLCRTDPKEAGRMGQTMLDRLSDMSVLSEIICAIRSDTTRNRSLTKSLADNCLEDKFRKEFIKKINAKHGKALGDRLGPRLEQLCTQYPWPRGRKNEKWLDRATAARECLAKFWQEFRDRWARKLREAQVHQEYIDEDLSLMQATQGERYLAELEAEKDDIHQRKLAQLAKNAHTEALAEPQTVWGKENTIPAPFPTRTKAKLRQESESKSPEKIAKAPTAETEVRTEVSVSPSSISVKRDHLTVFNHMFPCRGEESQRSFSWQHFLNAMTGAGFSILQSQGSAITLKLDQDRGEKVKTIVLHRPHPVATVNPVMLRSIAKRMQKWFGWKRELFVERGK